MLHRAIPLLLAKNSAYSGSMKSRKGTAPPQSAPTIPPPAPAKPSGKAAPQASATPAPSKAQATTGRPPAQPPSKPPTAPAAPVKTSKAAPAAPAVAAPVAASAPQARRQAPAPPQPVSGPTKPAPFNAMPRAAARPVPKALPVNEPVKVLPQIKPVIPQPSAAALRSVPRSVLEDAEELAAQPVHLHRVSAKPAPAPAPAPAAAKAPAPLPQTPAAPPPQARPVVIEVGEPVRTFGAPAAPLAAKEHAALCVYSAQVKMLRTDDEIGAAARVLGAEDASILRQVDRLRRLGGHSRTLCASDDAAVDRLTKAGLVVVLPWNGPKPPSPACYAELTPAGSAVLALLPQPSRADDVETTRTLQRYVEPRRVGRPPGKD